MNNDDFLSDTQSLVIRGNLDWNHPEADDVPRTAKHS
jgi:hypothetical protein